MKPAHAFIVVFFILSSCTVSNKITYSWTNKEFKFRTTYTSIFLAAMVTDPHLRTHLEEDMWKAARSNGFTAHRSWDYFTPSFSKPSPPVKDSMLAKVRSLGCNLIFTVNLVDKISETRYVPGSSGFYGPFPAYGLGFRGYYSYWYPFMIDPGYYVTDKTYFMEGNLFDAETETLLWSVQTKTTNPSSIESLSTELIDIMLRKALEDMSVRPAS
jgi:hypothetical protein